MLLLDWFNMLYQVLLGQEKGRVFGLFVVVYGVTNAVAMIHGALAQRVVLLLPQGRREAHQLDLQHVVVIVLLRLVGIHRVEFRESAHWPPRPDLDRSAPADPTTSEQGGVVSHPDTGSSRASPAAVRSG